MQNQSLTHCPGKPDFTAWFVLQGTIAAMHRAELYDAKDAEALSLYQILAQAGAKAWFLSKIIQRFPYGIQYKIGELVTHKGRLRHFLLRKKEIEKNTRKIISENDIRQVVVLGAGLDVLALRLAMEFPDIKFIEIDRTESQAFKINALALNDIKIPANMELVSGDLRNPLAEIFADSQLYKQELKTLWIAEGLFMFIPAENVPEIFRQVKAGCAPDSYFIFTTIAPKGQGGLLAETIQKLYLRQEKSQYSWAIFAHDVDKFIQKIGFQVVRQINSKLLHKNHSGYKSDINHKIGDDIHIARM